MEQDRWTQTVDTASRLHLRLLRFLTGALTLFLWLVFASGIWAVNRMIRFSVFGNFFGYIKEPSVIVSLILFALSYAGMFAALFWLCIVCRRLRIAKRLVVWCLLWIPFLNLGLALYVRGLARQEIDHNTCKIRLDDVRVEHQICRTKYPLLLVHGVGFRDFHYFNYWGRIPRELVRNGAKVYYGHQEAWGTVEDNGLILREKILEIVQETGCGKVNIIAHSKGGLDSRYLISGLHMDAYIASLTTINTPHRGSALVDFLKRLPESVYHGVCGMIDRYFGMLGDTRPNAYVASRQLSCDYAEGFNELYKDVPGIYYQSYASLMKHGFSSKLLCIPYWILKCLDAPNDGLVTVDSARWADFQGVVTNRYLRGISHGDMIDLTREDYRDFKVLEFYIQLVQRLAEMGF
ncbi:triacylglycerol lipase [Clostridium sp. AN503]|uniref:esterase/lipase family protein n=1 Tax=Clostridium sp. AN503 TaxID=3160598 RepID=UPI00345B2982